MVRENKDASGTDARAMDGIDGILNIRTYLKAVKDEILDELKHSTDLMTQSVEEEKLRMVQMIERFAKQEHAEAAQRELQAKLQEKK